MYCSKCGKRVLDSMLFCPFCGAGIVIPEQDVEVDGASEAVEGRLEAAPFQSLNRDADGFESERRGARSRTGEARIKPFSEEDLTWMDAPQEQASAPEQTEGALEAMTAKAEASSEQPSAGGGNDEAEASEDGRSARRPEGYRVPITPQPPENLFMDEAEEKDDFDAFEESYERSLRRSGKYLDDAPSSIDEDEDDDAYDVFDDDDDDDDDDGFQESFLVRHTRGIVGFILALALVAGLVLYGMTDDGQALLARMNLPVPIVDAKTYSRLGYAEYQKGNYSRAGVYYERALSREQDNYNYASSAAMAYIAQENTEKATELLKRCITINPRALEPYAYLAELYPDVASRAEEISQLIAQGEAIQLGPSEGEAQP